MKKLLVILFMAVMLSFAKSYAMQNIIVARGNDIVLCDVDNNTEKLITTIDHLNLWALAHCSYEESGYVLTLIRHSDYRCFVGSPSTFYSPKYQIEELIIKFDCKGVNQVETDSIKYEDGLYVRYKKETEKEILSLDSVRKLYGSTASVCVVNYGDVEFTDTFGNKSIILESEPRTYYWSAKANKDGTKIVCQKDITKYSRKNIVRRIIVEYDLKEIEFSNLQLEGSLPSYSEDAKYILYYRPYPQQSKKQNYYQAIYSIEEEREVFNCNGQQAIWVEDN